MKWLREPLVQFLLIGAVLFGIFQIWGGPSTAAAGQYHIVLTPAMVQNLIVSFQRSEKSAPTPKEIDGLINNYVREEIFNREARALGLDQDDTVIRGRLRDKMEYYLEDNAAVSPPADAQLEDFLQKNAISFRKDGVLPLLKDIHDAVSAAWEADQRKQTATAAYEKMRSRYTVDVQMPAPPAPAIANGTSSQK